LQVIYYDGITLKELILIFIKLNLKKNLKKILRYLSE